MKKSMTQLSAAFMSLTLSTLFLGAAMATIPTYSYADGAQAPTTFSNDDLQKIIPELANDTSALGQDLASGIAAVIAKLGAPTGVIVGSEAQGAFFVGYRKGSGSLMFKGQKASEATPLFWRAPSIGFNVGGSASRVAVLVYGTHSSDALLQKFVSVEGSLHTIGGGSISYLQSTQSAPDEQGIQLAYVAIGVGLDAGVSVEYLTFTTTDQWFPF